jgi:serine/threonine protein kinase
MTPPVPPGYSVNRLLGRGALGRSYLATKKGDPEGRVFKVLDRPDWLDEIPSLRLPGIWIGGKASDDEAAWIWTRHVEEGSLRTAMDRGSLPARDFAVILIHCLEILERIHGAGRIHGCLKPENILLPPREGVGITDVGHLPLLRSRDEEAARSYIYGTLVSRDARAPFAYLRPEALRANVAEPGGDVYAVGTILREGLEGSGRRPPIPDSLREIVRKLTSPPSKAYPTAEEARALLESLPEESWDSIPMIGTGMGPGGEDQAEFHRIFSFVEVPERPVLVAAGLPSEISVIDVAGASGPPPMEPQGSLAGGGGDEPEALDPNEALKFLESMKKPEEAPPKKKPPPEAEKGAYGVVVMGVQAGTKREAIADLIGPILNLTREEAEEKAAEPIISVLRDVSKLEAEKVYRRFKQAKVSARITTRLKKIT